MEIEGIKVHQSNINKKAPLDKKQYADCTYKPQTPPKCFYFGPYNPQMFGVLPNFKLAKTVSTAPVSFKGAVLKKSDFKGSDLAVIERYKPNIQQFKSKDDLQTFAESKINELKEKDFGGRQEETKIQRKAMLKEWFDYVIKENDAYSNTQRLIILSAITKDLKSNNDNIPDVLNKGVLAQTVTDLEERLKVNPKDNFDFHKMYKNNLRVSIMEDSSTGETMTGWIIIPSKINDPENFEKNVEKLKTLSHNSWCTKSFNAKPYLSQGDFHVYLENGQPKLGVRFVGDKVDEIQGEKNNGRIPIKYLETFKEHEKEYNMQLSYNAKSEVRNAEAVKVELEKVKQKLGSALELKTIDDAIKIFDYAEIEVEKKDNMLVISEYRQPNKNGEFEYEDLGIDENKLFKFVTKINGNADFCGSKITNLGQLQSIGGYADFRHSNITDLGQLQSIGSNANFHGSKITDLGQLQSIGGDADFKDSKITNLGQLQSIGGNADFCGSKITNLGQLQSIGGRANFRITSITNFGNLESIGRTVLINRTAPEIKELLKSLKYLQGRDIRKFKEIAKSGDAEKIFNAVGIETKKDESGKLILSEYRQPFAGLDYKDFDIDEENLFRNVVRIEGNANFSYSEISNLHNLESIGGDTEFVATEITSLGKLKSIDGNVKFGDSKITDLGNLQYIGGYANFDGSNITDLKNLETIGGTPIITYSKLTTLGNLKTIGGNVDFNYSGITDLGNLQTIGGTPVFDFSELTSLGNLKTIGGDVDFKYSKITDLGNLQTIGGTAVFGSSKLTTLGNLKTIGGDVDFRFSKITDLGQLQSIGGDVDFCNSQITNLGQLQSIGGDAKFQKCPLKDLKNLQSIGGNADFTHSEIESTPKLDTIGGKLQADENLRKVIMTNLKYLDGKAVDKNQEIYTQDELNKPIEQISTVENEEELNTESEENLTKPEQPQQPKQTFLSVVKNIIKKFVQ